jgi:hypothetical protein
VQERRDFEPWRVDHTHHDHPPSLHNPPRRDRMVIERQTHRHDRAALNRQRRKAYLGYRASISWQRSLDCSQELGSYVPLSRSSIPPYLQSQAWLIINTKSQIRLSPPPRPTHPRAPLPWLQRKTPLGRKALPS